MDREGSDQTAHARSLIWAFPFHLQNRVILKNIMTNTKEPYQIRSCAGRGHLLFAWKTNFHWRGADDCTVLHYTKLFIFILTWSRYELSNVETDVKNPNYHHHRHYYGHHYHHHHHHHYHPSMVSV